MGDPELVVFLLAYSNMTCPNQEVINEVNVQTNPAGLTSDESGFCIDTGILRGFGYGVSLCDGKQYSSADVNPDACFALPGIDPPSPGVGGGDGGGVVVGCDCFYEYGFDAACSGPDDPYCPVLD
ncbi:MAG: hypothetical protein ACREDR_04780 [Blastocatellia bacterium]